jgi:hypothetical protein
LAVQAEPIAAGTAEAERAGLNRSLAAQIREGRFDVRDRAALLDHLARTAADELAISNPRALES